MVDARWAEISQPPPSPIVPASLTGWMQAPGRAAIYLTKPGQKMRPYTQAERDFTNFWNKIAVDPYRVQSGFSKVAGGILKVAGAVIPALGMAQAAVDAGNAGLALSKVKQDERLAARVMTPAIDAIMLAEKNAANALSAQKDAELVAQIQALQLAPKAFVSQSPSTAQIQLPSTQASAKKKGLTSDQLAVIGVLGLIGFVFSRRES